MDTSPLHSWLDHEFFKSGAFLTSSDGETVILGKGGEIKEVRSFTDPSSPVFYLKDFYTDSYIAYHPQEMLECTREELEEAMASYPLPPTSKVAGSDDALYREDFQDLKEAFNDQLKKVVLISRENYSGFQGESTIKSLMKKAFGFGTGIPYGFWSKDYGIIGSTPELLYDLDGDILNTFALAGTAKAGQEKELLSSKKLRIEHDLVILDIKEKLSQFIQGIEVGETHVHPFKNIVHLKTDISGVTEDDIDLSELTSLLSPTAALGGYPKEASLKYLRKTRYAQKHNKRFFGSCFGLISEDFKAFIVAIRNVQWKDKELFIECGGGIVPDSELEAEYEEVLLKRNAIKNNYL